MTYSLFLFILLRNEPGGTAANIKSLSKSLHCIQLLHVRTDNEEDAIHSLYEFLLLCGKSLKMLQIGAPATNQRILDVIKYMPNLEELSFLCLTNPDLIERF